MATKEELAKKLQELRVQRGVIQGQQTKLKALLESKGNTWGSNELEARLSLLENHFGRFDAIQCKIESLDEEEVSGEKRDKYEETYLKIKTKILDLSENKRPRASISGVNDVSISGFGRKSTNMPKLVIPKFSGKIIDWPEYALTIKALITDDVIMPIIEKFTHLKNSLPDNVKMLITPLEPTEENYEKAIELLDARFNNKRIIFQAHLKEIFDFCSAEKTSLTKLRNLHDHIKAHYEAVSSLCSPLDLANGLIVFYVCRKLDLETQAKWEEDSSEEKIPTVLDFLQFIEKRCRTLENVDYMRQSTNSGLNNIRVSGNSNKFKQQNNKFVNVAAGHSKDNKNCEFCRKDDHKIYNCPAFLKLNPLERFNETKQRKLCINCLNHGHYVVKCKYGGCRHCKGKHNSLLHSNGFPNQEANELKVFNSPGAQNKSSAIASSNLDANNQPFLPVENSSYVYVSTNSRPKRLNNTQVILATAIIQIKNSSGTFVNARALLDSASQLNFVSEAFAQQLKIRRYKSDTTLSGIGGISSKTKFKTNFVIKSRVNNFSSHIEALVLPNITLNQPDHFIDIDNWNIPENVILADPLFHRPGKIDILLGAGVFFELLCVGQIKLGPNFPILQKTTLGWVVSGNTNHIANRSSCHVIHKTASVQDEALDSILKSFWELENINASFKISSREEIQCENHFVKHYTRLPNGRFSVKLPFKKDPSVLGDSFTIAKRRFINLEKKLLRLPDLQTDYSAFIHEFIELGHMEEIDIQSLPCPNYFLPHHAVFKPTSSSTKVRAVFDASCKTSAGESLNDILQVGPVIQDDLFTILSRFRSHKFALVADISKMYRQVNVTQPDCNLQCILWRNSLDQPLRAFRLKTLTYGTAPASFLATRCLKELAQLESKSYPIGSIVLERDFYVDDMLTGGETFKELSRIQKEVTDILSQGKFPIAKWASNNQEILKSLPESIKEKFLEINGDKVIKTLGMIWQTSFDNFQFTYQQQDVDAAKITKRLVLSSIARLFDPLGLINPVIVKAKVLMQKLWQLKLHWDESIPMDIHLQWKDFCAQLKSIKNIKIPRHVIYKSSIIIELHGFSDASSYAYGSCIYIRCKDKYNNINVHLLAAKSRVAPVKTVSIPRLELCAAHLLSELTHRFKEEILKHINISNTYCWSDSSIALTWLSSDPSKWVIFVGNRVSKIQDLTKNCIWRYVPTNQNPADLTSRGSSPLELSESKIWFTGPEFLKQPEFQWPASSFLVNNAPESRKVKSSFHSYIAEDIIASSKFINSYERLLKTFTYVVRFLAHMGFDDVLEANSTAEMEASLKFIVRYIQKVEFAQEYRMLAAKREIKSNSSLRSLSPWLDSERILRVGGRLKNSYLHFDAQHQIILPRSHPFTKCLIMHYHFRYNHAGGQSLLSIIRTRFWPIGGKLSVKSATFKCIHCFRIKPQSIQQLMGELPAERVRPSIPFTHSGVDFFGPLYVTSLVRGRAPTKVYMCIFICFTTKAIHLEVVSDLTSEAFIGALHRFISRRGKISILYSDNATNFCGANRKMKEFKKWFLSRETNKIITSLYKTDGIEWKFIPPRSPHFGGLWEAGVKQAKALFLRAAGSTTYTLEELHTLSCQIEAILNSRPLTPISNDPNDFEILTPGHFLTGASLVNLIQPVQQIENISRLTRWQRVQAAAHYFWSRWSKEYLHTLQNRYKWNKTFNNIQIGSMVLLKEENVPSLKWPLGRVIEIIKGRDNLVRVVNVKTKNGNFKRAIAKVCPLPIESTTVL